jgi:hypothetical protein
VACRGCAQSRGLTIVRHQAAAEQALVGTGFKPTCGSAASGIKN